MRLLELATVSTWKVLKPRDEIEVIHLITRWYGDLGSHSTAHDVSSYRPFQRSGHRYVTGAVVDLSVLPG